MGCAIEKRTLDVNNSVNPVFGTSIGGDATDLVCDLYMRNEGRKCSYTGLVSRENDDVQGIASGGLGGGKIVILQSANSGIAGYTQYRANAEALEIPV